MILILECMISTLLKKNLNPYMTRFLMSVEESVSLVIKAFSSAKSGEIIVHDAPGTSILNLAKNSRISSFFDSTISKISLCSSGAGSLLWNI